ncbi:MAG: GuaB3 family IMP dehydrogenase-related protein [Chloroflexi bacterium]|nr:GuaB3 family IMP dehydrogenase-related protein [Chloroflexota bacterium]
MSVPQFKEIRRTYGFDEVAIAPGVVTINPDQANIEFTIGEVTFPLPVLASAMDAVVSPAFALDMDKLGGLAVMNLEGVQTRYEDPDEVLCQVAQASPQELTALLQKIYSEPIRDNLIGERVRQIKEKGARCAVAITPASTKRLAPIAMEAGADILVVQSTVTTARHISKSYKGLIFSELLETVKAPVIVGNCVSYDATLELMETGIHGILVGVGPGAACTTREVVGVGVPQVTATLDCAEAREENYRRTGRYVSVITDGGIRTGGDLCKAFASGADAVMLGTPLAQAKEAPGQGYNWGMAATHPALPRGTRIRVGTKGSLRQILLGPSSVSDGTQNLIGALQVSMGMVGAFTIRDMHNAELIIAPAIKTEGKVFQMLQQG